MATHSSNLAWEIPWTEEPGGLESMSQKVRMVTLPLFPPVVCWAYDHFLMFPQPSQVSEG